MLQIFLFKRNRDLTDFRSNGHPLALISPLRRGFTVCIVDVCNSSFDSPGVDVEGWGLNDKGKQAIPE
jgi:hypothetical protein